MSLIINADGEYLTGTGGTFSPSSFTEMSFGIWVKRTTALSTYQGYAAIANSLVTESNAAALAHYWDKTDGFIWPGPAVRRGNNRGATESTLWQFLLFTYKQGGDVKVYTGITGGSLTNELFDGNNTTDAFSAAFTQIRIGAGMDTMLAAWNSRAKLAHCCFWTKELTAAEAGQLFNGGTAGAGKNPQAIQNANLTFYAPLTSDATVTVGGLSLSATGTLTYDGADNPNVEAYGSDTTAPTLSAASVTSVGTTTATGNVTTDEGNGTLYSIVSTSATAPSATQIQAGQNHTGAAATWSGNQAVSSTGAKTLSITGLTSSTSYYAHFQHKDAANNNSSVVTSAQFTTSTPDTTNPTMTGSVTISAKTTTSYTASWSAGSDNVAVTGYEYRLNAGSWVDLGAVLTVNISARTPGATDTFEVRAYDAAGNKATALSQSVTLFIGTITIPAVKDWGTGNLKTAQTGVQVDIHNISTGALVVRKTGQTTHATTGVCVVQDAAIADATTYEVITRFADGSKGMWDYTASLT